MSKQQLEHCVDCDNPTGRAGESDDSLRCEKCETGPLCPDCYHDHEAGQSLDCLTRQLAAMTWRFEAARNLIDALGTMDAMAGLAIPDPSAWQEGMRRLVKARATYRKAIEIPAGKDAAEPESEVSDE